MTEPWGVGSPEPTNLIVPWAAAETCDAEKLGRALAEGLGATVDLTPVPAPADEIRLAAVLESDALPAPAAVWIEASRGPLPGDLAGSARPTASVLGLETALQQDDPHGHYSTLLEMLVRLEPAAVAVLDVNTGLWRGRQTLDRQFGVEGSGPPDDALWIVQTIGPDASGGSGPCWLRTVGLRRCGRPELEMLEVPARLVETATTMLGAVATLLLDQPSTPAPGVVFEIGPDLQITLQPAAEVAAYVDGGKPDRGVTARPDEPVSAALCDPTPRGVYRPVWTWPRDVLERLDRGESAVYRTARSAERQMRAARSTWRRLLPVVDRLDETLVHALLDESPSESAGVAAWLRVTGVDRQAVRGEPLRAPMTGGPVAVQREAVSDWLARIGDRVFGPDDIDALEAAARGRRP